MDAGVEIGVLPAAAQGGKGGGAQQVYRRAGGGDEGLRAVAHHMGEADFRAKRCKG